MSDSRDPLAAATGRVAELERRLEQLERSSARRGFASVRRVVPSEASLHFRAAAREQLLGIRALVDHWIGRLDEGEAEDVGRSREEIRIE